MTHKPIDNTLYFAIVRYDITNQNMNENIPGEELTTTNLEDMLYRNRDKIGTNPNDVVKYTFGTHTEEHFIETTITKPRLFQIRVWMGGPLYSNAQFERTLSVDDAMMLAKNTQPQKTEPFNLRLRKSGKKRRYRYYYATRKQANGYKRSEQQRQQTNELAKEFQTMTHKAPKCQKFEYQDRQQHRSWKEFSKNSNQWGDLKPDPYYERDIPMQTEKFTYSGRNNAYFTHGLTYTLLDSGFHYPHHEYGYYINDNQCDPNNTDTDLAMFVTLSDLESNFKKISY